MEKYNTLFYDTLYCYLWNLSVCQSKRECTTLVFLKNITFIVTQSYKMSEIATAAFVLQVLNHDFAQCKSVEIAILFHPIKVVHSQDINKCLVENLRSGKIPRNSTGSQGTVWICPHRRV